MRTISKLKTFIIAILVSLFTQSARATGQVSDLLMWNGVMHVLLDLPLYLNGELADAFAKKYRVTSPHTANIRGYQGYWSIKDGELYLDSIRYCTQDIKCHELDTIIGELVERTVIPDDDELFAPYKTVKGVKATWVTENLLAATGEVVRYIHLGFMRAYEHEVSMQFCDGQLVRTIHTEYSKDADDNLVIHNEELEKCIANLLPEHKGSAKIKILVHDDDNDDPIIQTTTYISKQQTTQVVDGICFSKNFLRSYNIKWGLITDEPAYVEIWFDK